MLSVALLVQTCFLLSHTHNTYPPHALSDPPPSPDPLSLTLADPDSLTSSLLILINEERLSLSPPSSPLIQDEQLNWVATYRSSDMAASSYLDHVSPITQESASSILQAFGGPNSRGAAENILICFPHPSQPCDPPFTHLTFSRSTRHRHIYLDPQYTHFGAGSAKGPNNQYYLTELFTTQAP